MDAIRASFEAQFGTEWSEPVRSSTAAGKRDSQAVETVDVQDADLSDASSLSDDGEISDSDSGRADSGEHYESDGPITLRHTEPGAASVTPKAERRRFMAASAPKKASAVQKNNKVPTDEDKEDAANDLALRRLIEESHILSEKQDYTGADISLADPMEHIGKSRLKIMESRLEKAGALRTAQRVPMEIAKGMKAKAKERALKEKTYAKESGIILAKSKKARKQRVHDRGLKINSIGKATQHGIALSSLDIARVQRQARRKR